MTLYNPNLSHDEKAYQVPERSLFQGIIDVPRDLMSVWLTESSLKLWVRVWLFFLLGSCLAPLAFLPHPFAITNLVSLLVILFFDGREGIRVRGLNKNMGWPHLVGFIPTIVVGIMSVTTDIIGEDGKLTWGAAGDDTYKQARVVLIWYCSIAQFISVLFDIADTIMYQKYGKKNIERSAWTTSQLVQSAETAPPEVAKV